MPARVANRSALTKIIETVLAESPVEDVLFRLRAAQVPCAPVLAVDGVVVDPHVAARGVLTAATDSAIGEILQTRMPIGDGRPPRSAPLLGEHSREILAELGFTAEDIQTFITSGAVLDRPAPDS